MSIEINDKGHLLLDPEKVAQEAAGEKFSRYNGGWVKNVNRLDKSKTNGFSLVGEFFKSGLTWMPPGVYVDCSIDGSRKYPERHYTLFRLHPDGRVEKLDYIKDERDWAVRFWPKIEEVMSNLGNSPLLAMAEWLDQIYSNLSESASSLSGERKAAAKRALESISLAIDEVRIAAGVDGVRE